MVVGYVLHIHMPRKKKLKTPSDYPYLPVRIPEELDMRLTAVARALKQSKGAVTRACLFGHLPKLEAASKLIKTS